LHAFIRENTSGDTEAIYTDEWGAYKGIADENTKHKMVKHRDKVRPRLPSNRARC
jgi:hypothetical protein